MNSNKIYSPRTMAVQAGHYTDPHTGAVTPPVHPSTTFARDHNYETIYSATYSRDGNPTYDQLETVLATLDGGVGARLFAPAAQRAALGVPPTHCLPLSTPPPQEERCREIVTKAATRFSPNVRH